MKYCDWIQVFSIDGSFYGANFGAQKGQTIDYLAGMAVKDVSDVPAGLALHQAPASRYAAFESTVQTIGET